jgi:hypothetical protein
LQPYVIRQGDYLLSLAHQFGFDADTIWNDPANDALRKLRPNPNILLAGDQLYIPDQVDKKPVTLVTGQTNSFVSPDPPTVTITHQFVGNDPSAYATKAYSIQELAQLTGLQTDEDGVVTFEAPVTLDTATVVFTDTGESWALAIGNLDPIDTPVGIFERLQNLGHIDSTVQYDFESVANNLDVMRDGLRSFKGAQPTSDQTAPDSSASEGSPPPSAPASSPGSPSSSSDPSLLTQASSLDLMNSDICGLADDGSLDTETAGLLLKVYGH